MPQLCFYFQLHQPFRLREFNVFDMDQTASYFLDESDSNRKIFEKVAEKSYRPMLQLLLNLVNELPSFRFAVSISGIFLEQAQEFAPDIVALLVRLARTGQVEFLAETYYHSLASLYSASEFIQQVKMQHQLVFELFGVHPTTFRNTELIYWNELAPLVHQLGYQAILTEAVPRYLGHRPKTRVYRSNSQPSLPILLKHAELSDDIAFRFSDRNWHWYPLTVDRFQSWLTDYGDDEQINIFLDFETFGEHQWADTGIFEFFAELIRRQSEVDNAFVTPADVAAPYLAQSLVRGQQHSRLLKKLPVYDVPDPISWADVDRDLTAWRDNPLQWDTLRSVYDLEATIQSLNDPLLLTDWRRLQTSDHFYYMCTKWAADGDVHAYFSPYRDPYEAYRRYSIVLADLKSRVSRALSAVRKHEKIEPRKNNLVLIET